MSMRDLRPDSAAWIASRSWSMLSLTFRGTWVEVTASNEVFGGARIGAWGTLVNAREVEHMQRTMDR